MKLYGQVAIITLLALLASFPGCYSARQRAMDAKELSLYEVTPGELAGREDILKDLHWWKGYFPVDVRKTDLPRRSPGLWTGRDVYRVAFAGDPVPKETAPENYETRDEKKLMDRCRKQLLENLIEFRLEFQYKEGLFKGCVDYPSTAMAWRKEMQGMRLLRDNLRILKKEIRKDGSFHIILETRYKGLRDFLTKKD